MRQWVERLRRWLTGRDVPLGLRGERLAARMLRRKGYKIVARGERNRLGELDLVAVDGRTVVFVEVRTRSSQDHGSPADTITPDKQRRVTRAAVAYLKQHGLLGYACRFDVVAITWPSRNAAPQIEHLVSAFDATGFRGMFS